MWEYLPEIGAFLVAVAVLFLFLHLSNEKRDSIEVTSILMSIVYLNNNNYVVVLKLQDINDYTIGLKQFPGTARDKLTSLVDKVTEYIGEHYNYHRVPQETDEKINMDTEFLLVAKGKYVHKKKILRDTTLKYLEAEE